MQSKKPHVAIRLKTTGFIIVLDNTIHCRNKDKVFAYSLKDDVLKKYNRDTIRHNGEEVEGKEGISAISSYQNWKDTESGKEHLYELDKREQQEEEVLRRLNDKASQSIIDKHKQHLYNLGIEYGGVRHPSTKRHRVTHCWKCGSHLDNSIDVECGVCEWIICGCGACGCGVKY